MLLSNAIPSSLPYILNNNELGRGLYVLTDSIAALITEVRAVTSKTWRMLTEFPSLEQLLQ